VSPSAYITKRETGKGTRYVVRYRLGGRGFKLRHAGSFQSMKAARLRRDFVISEISAGRDPMTTLRTLEQKQPQRTFAQEAARWQTSRLDHAEETRKNVESHLKRLLLFFGESDPHSITVADVREWVATQAGGEYPLKASSLKHYVGTFRQVLDFAGVDPNPARDKNLHLPRIEQEEVEPPSSVHMRKMLQHMPNRWKLPLTVLEQTGMRVGELHRLEWRDVDVTGLRFRVRSGKTRAARRWVTVPDTTMIAVSSTCPPDDRAPERRVFPGFTPDVAKNVMARACKAAGIPHYHPHDLRHRYASRMLQQGIPVTNLAAQLGHSRKSLTLDTYSHVLTVEDEDAV
jgi:integrase